MDGIGLQFLPKYRRAHTAIAMPEAHKRTDRIPRGMLFGITGKFATHGDRERAMNPMMNTSVAGRHHPPSRRTIFFTPRAEMIQYPMKTTHNPKIMKLNDNMTVDIILRL